MENNKSKIKASDFEEVKLTFADLPEEVREEARKLSKTRRGQLERHYETAEDYFTIFYSLRFYGDDGENGKYSNNEIAMILSKSHDTVNHIFEDLRFELSDSWDENQHLYQELYTELAKRRQEGMENIKQLDIKKHAQLYEMLSNPQKIKTVKKIIKSGTCGDSFDDHESFMKELYYFYKIEGMRPIDICRMFGWYKGSMQDWVNKLGIRRTPAEGMEMKKINKSQDYKKTFITGSQTQLKSRIENYDHTTSQKESILARYLALEVSSVFDETKHHAITGIKNKGILSGMEIDIPIIVLNHQQNYLHLFAVEYNHIDNSKKISRLKEAGWEFIPVDDKTAYSRNPKTLKDKSRDLALYLYQRVQERELGEMVKLQILTGSQEA